MMGRQNIIPTSHKIEVAEFYRTSKDCTNCFISKKATRHPNSCNVPQPRWIGQKYFETNPRIVMCMANPGAGKWFKGANMKQKMMYDHYFSGRWTFRHLCEKIKDDMYRWGSGKYVEQVTDLGLDLNSIATMNIALCPMVNKQENDICPNDAADLCYLLWTKDLLVLLKPDVVLLCGAVPQRFAHPIQVDIGCRTLDVPHYANRLNKETRKIKYTRLREQIDE